MAGRRSGLRLRVRVPLGTSPDPQDAQVATCCSIAHARADAFGDGVEQGFTDIAVEPSIRRLRAKEIGIDFVIQDARDKLPAYRRLLGETGVLPEQVCYIGDDLPDLPVLGAVGLAACPADAVAEVRRVPAEEYARYGVLFG